MSVTPVEESTTLSSDLFYDILRRLDGPSLASAACTCATFYSISKEEKLWENVCSSIWPSTNREDVKHLISSIGGFRKFYSDCFLLIINKEVIEYPPKTYPEPDYYYDLDYELETISPSDFVFLVDIKYKDKPICSKVLWEVPNANNRFSDWFYNCPFRIDLLTNENTDFTLSVSDGLPPITSMERERKGGKLWRELRNELRLSWIIINKKTMQAANVTSWIPLGGQRHWPTDKDFLIRFGSILPAKEIIPCQVVECVLCVKFRAIEEDGVETDLKLTELSMQMEEMEGGFVNGRNGLAILKEALGCSRSKDYGEVMESCRLYSRVQKRLKEEKMRNESWLDRVCILIGITIFVLFWYYIL